MDTIHSDRVGPLLADLALSAGNSPAADLASTRATLLRLVADPHLLAKTRLTRQPTGYTRNLLFSAEAVSVWAMVWAPGSATPVHDHHCTCCFGLLTGTLRETLYRPISGTHAVAVADVVRSPGFVACMRPSGPNLHGMTNDGSEEAISIHVYGYDHLARPSSVHQTFRVATM